MHAYLTRFRIGETHNTNLGIMDIVLTDSEMPFLTLTKDICIMELHRMVGLIGVTIDQTAMGIKRSEDQ